MARHRYSRFNFHRMLLVSFLALPMLEAATQSTILKVCESGACLYLHNDSESEKMETLRAGTELSLIIQTIGQSTWYQVRTPSGRVGWVSAADVEPVKTAGPPAMADEAIYEFGPGSAWSANIRNGGVLSGTWTGTLDRSTGTAMGDWALRDGADRVVLSGSWSAVKSPGEWRGSWRAFVEGQTQEHSGTWVSEVRLGLTLPFASMFEQAMRETITGTWQSAGRSGRWSIRVIRSKGHE
jgi:hypothetical protein